MLMSHNFRRKVNAVGKGPRKKMLLVYVGTSDNSNQPKLEMKTVCKVDTTLVSTH